MDSPNNKDDKRQSLLSLTSNEHGGILSEHDDPLGVGPPTVLSSNSWQSTTTVYEEMRDMLLAAVLIYGVVDLRTLAKRRQQQKERRRPDDDDDWKMMEEDLLHLPIAAKDVVRLMARQRDTIQQEIGLERTELYLDAFDSIASSTSSSQRELELEFCNGRVSLVSFDVVAVDDENQQEELVYAISVDSSRRRITVLFRGCRTSTDWKVCATNFLKVLPNPLYDQDDDNNNNISNSDIMSMTSTSNIQPETIAIHQGYCDYLFSNKTPKNSKTTGSGRSKFDAIVQHVQALLQQHPGYQVYATGHSLGAALATVFSFQAATTQCFGPDVIISCINFASPMVGNLDFETAFRQLETQGRIRFLRVTNHFDIFTQLPDRGNWLYVFACCCCGGFNVITYVGWMLLFFLFCQNHVYRHVGMDFHMYRRYRRTWWCFAKDEVYSYKIKHPRGTPQSFVYRVAHDGKKHLKQTLQRLLALPFAVNFKANHSVKEHLWRLTQLASKMEGIYLKDLYETQRASRETMTSLCGVGV